MMQTRQFTVTTPPTDVVDDAAELEYISAHALAFSMSAHLSRKAFISGLADADARRQLETARATMARLIPAAGGDDDA